MRVRWGWLATAVGMLVAGALALAATSTYGCASGASGVCGPDAVDRVRETVIVVAALTGAGWAVWRAVRCGEARHGGASGR